MATSGDHPRVCGEHRVKAVVMSTKWGSSPRMRGTQVRGRSGILRHGIIPAYAGNTGAVLDSDFHRGDHPRVCGEHAASLMRLT